LFALNLIIVKPKRVKKTKFVLISLLPLQWVLLLLAKSNSKWIEVNYSENIYPFFFNLQAFFLKNIPFSFGDIFYVSIIFYLVGSFIYFIKNKIKIQIFIINIIAATSLLSLFFHLHWGLNYYRTPLNEKLNYDVEYNEDDLERTLESIIETTNKLHKNLTNEDSIPVKIPYSKEKIIQLIEKDFDFDLYDFKIRPFLKNSIWSKLLSYMGFAGYINPITLESQINYKIPKLNYITTATHEMAHQLGIASESEANFVAFYTTSVHPDPFIQFAAYSFAINYCYSELFKADQEKAKNQISKLNHGVLKNFQQLSDFWVKFQNPFEPFFKKGYDSYLKANGQVKGIKSYNAMVGMLIAYTLKNDINPK